ncbi:MAG: hypothetical protein OEX12_05085 [Gammaproteobacteria bacterium]|nr:hypothetical protein [Gammaproteobacteria bacterium]
MRIVSSSAEMRNQYYYAEFRHQQERLRIQHHATPPSQRSPTIKSQKDKRSNSAPDETRLAIDELTITLISILLKRLTGVDPLVMSLAELNKQLNTQTTTAKMWQHLAELLQDILLPIQYPHSHFDSTAVTLPLPLHVTSENKTTMRLDAEIKLSALWKQYMPLSTETDMQEILAPLYIQMDSNYLDLPQTCISLELDINLNRYKTEQMQARTGEKYSHHNNPISDQDIFNCLQILEKDETGAHRLLAMGLEGFGVLFLGSLPTVPLYHMSKYLDAEGKTIIIPQIDFTV